MPRRTVRLTIEFEVSDVDERVTREDWLVALNSALDIRDGRQDYTTEAFGQNAADLTLSFASNALGAMGQRWAVHYPALRSRGSWAFTERLPKPHIVRSSYTRFEVSVDGQAFARPLALFLALPTLGRDREVDILDDQHALFHEEVAHLDRVLVRHAVRKLLDTHALAFEKHALSMCIGRALVEHECSRLELEPRLVRG